MHVGKLVFAHVMEFTPWRMFRRRVARYGGDFNVSSFGCMDQFLCMAFAQPTYRESLRDIEACLGATRQALSSGHLGQRHPQQPGRCQRDTRLARPVRVTLFRNARHLYAQDPPYPRTTLSSNPNRSTTSGATRHRRSCCDHTPPAALTCWRSSRS